ncbi:MAG: hypothetical protein CMC76_09680 [Flavobacteriaceae bacterium]|nr:hypothetical protein [Flavobacteriaceae bacterium]|tara:strand:+ start:1124 stop:1474 length:351 start_codon:yes stop_codon:yes gene_type:complete
MKSTKFFKVIGVVFLLLQLASIIYARFIPERFFCWAPYDEHTHYSINVTIDGQTLSKNQIKQRYHYRPEGWETRSIDNVFSIVQQYEDTYGKNDQAKVEIRYNTNGNSEQIWRPTK